MNDYSLTSKLYSSIDNTGTTYLAFKTIPNILSCYSNGKKTLDYGCGTGSSTFFLNEIGLDVVGVDICPNMLQEAKKNITNTKFTLIKSAELPYSDNTFDIVFSSFVLLEISNKNELVKIIKEIYRILKSKGLFIIVTGSEDLYSHNWLSLNVNYTENRELKSGHIAKVLLKDADLVVYDYYWTDEDYREVIAQTEFSILETLHPLGEDCDGYPWKDEKLFPPYVIYVLRK